ncbi:uncharacterized protein LOC108251393 [Kryptolebias marmoratus]|uniref:Uncharacterized LOC108251393 n=1 Tax=Kryptolebias marmoratus TaxID=37003 RepID=A0A3Q3GYC2_KRYMA|nr:uncharacterized protein LOC108251393 [Kryptolebias marmoratus]
MVQWQLCTLDHLNISGFGRPPPRHGLQLLFWFSNHCVTFEPDNCGLMLLVSDCEPEKGVYGFHRFGNIEELLPVLCKLKKHKKKKQLLYFEVGNLNTMTYPESADLPASVREYYGIGGKYNGSNMDRIIISYQVKTRVVEKVYVTEHDNEDLGGFRSDGTHEISPELIRVLQDPQLDLSTFLTFMGYYGDVEVLQETEDMQDFLDPSVQMIFNMMQNDSCRFFSDGLRQYMNLTFDPCSYDQQEQQSFSTSSSVGPVTQFTKIKQKNKKSKAKKRQKVLRETYWDPRWDHLYRAVDDGWSSEKRPGGGFSLLKIILGVGAIYLGAKCFSWLMRSNILRIIPQIFPRIIPRRTPSFPQTHIMLDYVY